MWFDYDCQAATDNKNKAYRKMQQGYGTRSLTEEYKDNRREKIHKKEKRMDEHGIRKYGIAEETT